MKTISKNLKFAALALTLIAALLAPRPVLAETPALTPDAVLKNIADSTFSGEKVSLQFADANLEKLMEFFTQIAGFPIACETELNGTVYTFAAADSPWDEGLAKMLKTLNLSIKKEGEGLLIFREASH